MNIPIRLGDLITSAKHEDLPQNLLGVIWILSLWLLFTVFNI